ncbi:phasin family protein [Bermanella sp. WJH001]|uniref:phasin family protein n=1 Tax=Bermanella sp. WJH001 TaxID=3048005 RepID=UPI0024BDCA8D|nr:phasin family protein [Bermanella sp. WJH001]MDJ1536840.1 phasin family protein [Bermanella sp. WJH001]
MQENIMNAFTEQAKSFYSPLNKLSALMVENMEKMTEFQLESIKSYADITMSQMKKAVDVKDADSLRSFSTSQTEAAATVNKKIMEDAKSLSDLANDFKSQVEAIWEESRPATKPAEKKPTKAA